MVLTEDNADPPTLPFGCVQMELGPEGVKAQEARMQQLKKEALERAARNKRVDVHEEMIDQVRMWS